MPRPPKYPCGECSKACTSYRGAKASILCESCNIWFHSDCVGLSESALDILDHSDLPWECHKCGMPTFSSGIFNSTLLDKSSSESHLSNSRNLSSSSTSSSHPGSPLAKSSPSKTGTQRSFQNLRLLEVNFQSIFSKRTEFWHLLDKVRPDVIYGCETWLNPNISNGEIFPPGYSVYRCDKKDGHGGALLGIDDSLNYQIDIESEVDFVAAKIVNGNHSIVVASLYRPTNNDLQYMEELTSIISHLCISNPGCPIWISGDINLPDIDWSTNSIVSYQYRLALNQSFLQLMTSTGLEQMVDFPTRGDNTLDIILTNRPSLTNTCASLPGLSDHDLVFMDANVRANRRKPVQRKILLWKKADLVDIRQRVSAVSEKFTSEHNTSTPVENLASVLQQELDKIIIDCVPSKLSCTRVNQPWFNAETKCALRRKGRAFTKARRTNKERDWSRYKRLKGYAQRTCRRVYNNYVHDIISSEPGNRSKKLGALIKSKRCDSSGIAPLKDGGYLHTDPKTKANILNRQFTSVFSRDNGAPIPDLGDSQHPSMDDIHVSLNGVIKLLKNLKRFSAPGPDGIPTMLLKETAEEIAPAVKLLFQASINQGTVPSSWKKAHIVPCSKREVVLRLQTTDQSL
ncbi:uncharacterized protein [Amphiura filiformis]|uniref:uncharacterized protein n=1 Tax=Amphiura filiformis TaxID=82378 RepID=UPI003B21423C